ncbi:MAG: cytochrome d ubiquinol oxidase subunit II [Acidimicrobiales bacterium]|jgi:cytochrome d ubiquinol oxidase subunit II
MISTIVSQPGNLQILWFALIALLWLGYFFLEGFDFGVGMLAPFLSKDDTDRRICVNAIGPTWDGNEVWLLVAGGATFAAFPRWYATVFSGFYLPLFLVLLALIARGVSFEWRSKRPEARWRAAWDKAIFWGSVVPSLLWGVAFADFVSGVPVNSHGEVVGGFFRLVEPYALLGGLVTLSLFLLHGATFLSLKTEGPLRERAQRAAGLLAPIALVITFGFLTWTYLTAHRTHEMGIVPGFIPVLALVLIAGVSWLVREKLEGWAFVATGAGILLTMLTIFLNLYPRVLVSTISRANSLTIVNTASQHYTLGVMTIVAAIFTPFVLLYQGWSYWVFRARVRRPT